MDISAGGQLGFQKRREFRFSRTIPWGAPFFRIEARRAFIRLGGQAHAKRKPREATRATIDPIANKPVLGWYALPIAPRFALKSLWATAPTSRRSRISLSLVLRCGYLWDPVGIVDCVLEAAPLAGFLASSAKRSITAPNASRIKPQMRLMLIPGVIKSG